jgi:hypothetical protein
LKNWKKKPMLKKLGFKKKKNYLREKEWGGGS